MFVFRRLCLLVAFAAMLAACAAVRPPESASTRALVPLEAIDYLAEPEFGPDAGSFSALTAGRRHHVLALSSGGAEGAYGAGVLKGWSESGTRPEFDIVSGVSTGALIAVLAFLGPDYDDDLERFYTEVRRRDVFRIRSAVPLLTDSLLDNSPLKTRIEAVVTPQLLARVAAEHQKGRRLYIATTNLDAGDLVVWNMGEVALGGRADRVQFFQKILRASAAIPALFPPVYIKPVTGRQLRQAHVDGGLKAPVLIGDYMFPPEAKGSDLFVIVNGFTRRLNDTAPVNASVLSIARKSIQELTRELLSDTIFRSYVLTRQVGAGFYLTSIPEEFQIPNRNLNFDPERNRDLFEAGRRAGRAGIGTWYRHPPHVNERERRVGG